MAIFEVDKDAMMEIFESKESIKKSVFAVMENRLTAAHLVSDVYILLEMLDKLEVALIGEPIVQAPPAEVQAPAPEQSQESAPTEQTQPEQNQSQEQ